MPMMLATLEKNPAKGLLGVHSWMRWREVLAVHGLRLQDQVVEREVEQGLDGIDAPALGVRVATGRVDRGRGLAALDGDGGNGCVHP